MATRKRSGNSRGILGKVVWFVVLGSAIITFYNIPHDPSVNDVKGILVSKSDTIGSWMENCVPQAVKGDFSHCSLGSNVKGAGTTIGDNGGVEGSGNSGTGTSATPSAVKTQLNDLKVAPAEKVAYNRDEWPLWISQGPSCWNTRDAVLYRQAKPGSVVLLDSNKKVTTDKSSACSIQSGSWVDPYSNTTVTNPISLDIDHVIPLGYAAAHGGQAWSKAQKQAYANDLTDPNHLLAVGLSENRQKGDSGPSVWKPPATSAQCFYATTWVTVATKYKLSITSADKSALSSMLATCKA